MSKRFMMFSLLSATALALGTVSCDEPTGQPAASSATSAPPATTAPPAKTSSPKASAAAPKPSHPCPDGSEGTGTLKSPCLAKGTTRTMQVEWTGKIGDKGPSFRVVNNTKLEILYGNVVVYFYDKTGKQLEVPSQGGGKGRRRISCAGNIFAGPMKAGEKATLWFSCVKNKQVPATTAAIEAEMRTVGFTAKDGGKPDTYWRNEDLTPEDRAKGGIK